MIEFAKEQVEVLLVNDELAKVWLYKYLNMPQRQSLLSQYTKKLGFRGTGIEMEIDIAGLQEALLRKLWAAEANGETKIEDVSVDSINPYIAEKMRSFLTLGLGDILQNATDSSTLESATVKK